MGRIRSIKPELPQSQSLSRLDRETRLCFILLWTLADDSGRFRGNPRLVASLLFPFDPDAGELIEGWLSGLEGEGCIQRYEVDRTEYIQIRNWSLHQKIDKRSASKFPPPPIPPESSGEPPESYAGDQGSRIKDQGSRIKDKSAAPPRRARAVARPDDVPPGVWDDWLAVRKAKRAGPATATVLKQMTAQAALAKLTLAQAIEHCAARGWQAFQADWLKPNQFGKPKDAPVGGRTWMDQQTAQTKDSDFDYTPEEDAEWEADRERLEAEFAADQEKTK